MLDISNAPAKGRLYALLRDEVKFESYEALKDIEDIVNDEKLLELHLFDKEKEYRMIRTRMDGFVTAVIDDSQKCDDIYEETVFVLGKDVDQTENLKEKVTVVNYITYNEDDMITICNYRLKEVD